MQRRLCDCDPPTIHRASLNCKLSLAVKFKSFILKIRFLQTVSNFDYVLPFLTFYLSLAGLNHVGIQNNFNGFSLIDVYEKSTLSALLKVVGRVLLVTAVIKDANKYIEGMLI